MDTNNEIKFEFKADGTGQCLPKKITNGSTLTIGEKFYCVTIYNVNQHFNWFQKLMWKWAFGIKVEDYSEE